MNNSVNIVDKAHNINPEFQSPIQYSAPLVIGVNKVKMITSRAEHTNTLVENFIIQGKQIYRGLNQKQSRFSNSVYMQAKRRARIRQMLRILQF